MHATGPQDNRCTRPFGTYAGCCMRASLNACLQDQTLPHASLFDHQDHLCCLCRKMISCASGLSATPSATPKEGSQSAQTQPDASEEYLNSLAIHKLIFSSTACQCGTQKWSSVCLSLLGEPFPNKIFVQRLRKMEWNSDGLSNLSCWLVGFLHVRTSPFDMPFKAAELRLP